MIRSPVAGTDGAPNGSGKCGRLPPFSCAKSIHARTPGDSRVKADRYSCCHTQ
ncbi:Uncharacterised protein [Mycobacterium tuberculosis]|nr:Uncharacterised protein [Mycobacterium tuberculosis]